MDQNEFPTKGNLIYTQHTLALARQGYILLDQKRNVLVREITALKDQINELQKQLDELLKAATAALINANIEMGSSRVEAAASSVCIENTIQVHTRNIMGVEIPLTKKENASNQAPPYDLACTTLALDEACQQFNKVKDLIVTLAAVENTAHRLEINIRKTQKRANALQYIIIPRYENRLKFIQNALEERERDGFVRLKIGKNQL